jgi:5'-3' exonuclease
MGLPGFFAWILKKYAKNILLNKLQINPKYLYIDANCLFHPECFKILEGYQTDNLNSLKDKMFKRIVNLLDFLEKYVSPTEMMYIAVDGTAPVAKIIQQRKRRYKSELDNKMKNEIKLKYGIISNESWSNTSITPGTEFMEDLHIYLLNHYNNKNSKIKYIYSSYHTPGEGEHKILQHIKKNTKIDDNIIIYGLDADLIFLAMASNRDNIYLLREQSLFNQKDKKKESKDEKKEFDYINDVQREMTYVSIRETKTSFNIDLEHKISYFNKNFKHFNYSNDLIFVCFLLGNDFLPHLPSIDIHHEGLDELLESYIKTLLKFKNPLIEKDIDANGEIKDIIINNIFFQSLIEDMGEKETCYFYNNLYESMEKHKRKKCFEEEPYKKEVWCMENLKQAENIDNLQLGVDTKDIWKYRYYEYYFKISGKQDKYVNNLCDMYLTGIKWMTKYYFQECPDWKWNYVCHHAPFISDIAIFSKNKDINNINFINNKHIPMMSQLLSVFPPSCNNYLPESYRHLVLNQDSPVLDLFPIKVKIDTLYKSQLYQCIPLIPYLEIDRIIEATKKLKLTDKESKRSEIFEDIQI